MTDSLEIELNNRQQAWALMKSVVFPFLADAAKAYSTAARELHGSYAANDLAPRERGH